MAVFLKMLKFDFYNDWVSGSLYFPLIKRKYKVRKSKKKFGQIKKDKFCHYNCLTKNANPPQFQGYATFLQDRIKLDVGYSTPTVTIQGCSARLDANIVSDWYGDYNSNSIDNLNLAAKQIVLDGTNDADKKCQITFDNYASLQGALNNISGLQVVAETKVGANPFGEPDYVKTIDQFGTETWENQGGFGLHKNKCDPTRMIERGEYFKNSLDCWNTPPSLGSTGAPMVFPPDIDPPNPLDPCIYNCLGGLPNDLSTSWQAECCRSTCGTNSVAGCNAFCSCRGANAPEGLLNYNGQLIEHGLIMWYDQELYYTSIIPKGDYSYNDLEYKANIMLPTTITELGSTTYCDIDDVPFIMDKLQPTTFQVSYEAIKYKIDNVINNYTPPPNSGNPPGIRKDLNYGEDKEGALNLRGYVDFSCLATTCLNTPATVNQSQIGVDTIDTNDLEIEISNCFMRFEHDTEIREYFCRRFSGYKDGDLNVHYMRPGSNEFENDYQTYDEITLVDGTPTYYRLVDDFSSGDPILSTYNDGDAFVPGDACGFYKDTNPTGSDYFYGLAPGQTSSFVNFPNSTTPPLITFGQNAHSGGVDDVDDGINGSGTIYGIKFNRSQTPYYLYFGLLPGKTALHKTVGKFFADKINAVTLQGIGASNDDASENTNNQNNLRHEVTNPFSIYKTCLGETLIASQTGGGGTPGGSGGSGGVNTPGGNIGNTTPIGIGGTTGLANPPGGGLSTGGNVGSNSQTTPTTTITNYTISGTQGVGYGFPSMAATALINVFNAPAVITLSLFGGTFCPTIPPISNSKGAGGLNLYNGGTTTLTQPNVAQIGMSSNLGGLGVSIQNGTSTVATADEIKTITITINQTGTYDLNLSYSPLNCNQDGYFKIL